MALLILAGLQTIASDMYEAGAYRWSYRSQNILLFDASVHHANAACGTIKKRFSLLYGQTPSADASAAVEYT